MRVFLKSLGWESISLVLTLIISYIIVGDLAEATTLTLLLFGMKLSLLCMYEKVWEQL